VEEPEGREKKAREKWEGMKKGSWEKFLSRAGEL